MRITSRRTSVKRNVWKLHVFSFLSTFTLFTPVIVLFFLENGLNMTQVMILQSAYSAMVILLEVPSGYISDTFGRKNTLIAASSFMTVGIGIYSIGTGFWSFLAGELTFAVGGALLSGADAAMMYDTLDYLGREEDYRKLWGKASSYALISAAIASVAGGLIAEYSLRFTLYGMVPVFLALVPLSISMKEPPRQKRQRENHLKQIIQTGKRTFIGNRKLRWIIVYSAIIALLVKAGYFLYQPYFELSSIPVAYFGVIFAAFNIISALLSRYADEIESILGLRLSLVSLVVLSFTGFILMGVTATVFSFVFAGLHSLVRGFKEPVISDYINSLTSSTERSTVLSFESLAGRSIYALLLPLIGMISDTYGIQAAMTSMAATSLLLAVPILAILFYEEMI